MRAIADVSVNDLAIDDQRELQWRPVRQVQLHRVKEAIHGLAGRDRANNSSKRECGHQTSHDDRLSQGR
jgi:hypothetical protein